jgi:hypothetical protein
MTLQCSDEKCRTENDQHIFNITLTVGSDREVSENVNKIPPSCFLCCFCNSEAEDVVETKEESFG